MKTFHVSLHRKASKNFVVLCGFYLLFSRLSGALILMAKVMKIVFRRLTAAADIMLSANQVIDYKAVFPY